MLPAFTVSILSILILTIYEGMTLRKAAIELYGCTWFLKCLFLCYIIVWLSITVLKNVWLTFLVSEILLLCMPFGYAFGINFLIIFFWNGYIISKYGIFERLVNYQYVFFILTCTSLLMFLFFASKGWAVHYRAIDKELLFDNPLLLPKQFIVGLSGTLFVIALCYYISNINNKAVSWLEEIGKYTLGIYVLQNILLERILVFIIKPVLITPSWETEYLLCPLIGITITFLCFFLIRYLRRNYYLNLFFFGGTYK